MGSDGNSEWLGTSEAASLLGYGSRHLRTLLWSGKVKGEQLPGGKWRIHRSVIDGLRAPGAEEDNPDEHVKSHWSEIASPHDQELRGLLARWLELEEEVTIWSWIQGILGHLVSPAALLNLAHGIVPDGNETEDSAPTADQIRDGLLESYAPHLARSVPPPLVRSPQFTALCQHLEGDILWEESKSAEEALARLSAHVWTGAPQISGLVTGKLIAPICPLHTGEVERKWNRIIRDRDYRDRASRVLCAAAQILGAHLIGRGLDESGQYPDAKGVTYQFRLEMEDLLQRVEFPVDWSRPRVGEIREIADGIWDGSEGEALSKSLGKESVEELLKLWQQWSQSTELLRMRLRNLIALRPFPGSCPECLATP